MDFVSYYTFCFMDFKKKKKKKNKIKNKRNAETHTDKRQIAW